MIPALLAVALATAPPTPGEPISFGRFGHVAIYRPTGIPLRAALFVSGDGGWNRGVVHMASALSEEGALVVGIDIRTYLRAVDAAPEQCAYIAADFEALSQYLQKRLELPHYLPPVLVGFSSGAGLVYAALAQAPDNTFSGAVSLGFCADLALSHPPCHEGGLESEPSRRGRKTLLKPVAAVNAPWIILQGEDDVTCPADSAAAFADRVKGAELIRLPRVGHGFSVESRWLPQLRAAVSGFRTPDSAVARNDSLGDLPLVEIVPHDVRTSYFAVVLSGDGGWASIDKQIGEELAANGVPVVGFNSLQYFWRKRTPEESGADLARIIRHYQGAWKKQAVVLVGYSRGADVLPLMANRLPPELLEQVRLIAFLGIEHATNLEFRLGDWLGARHEADYKLLPEVERLKGRHLLCVYGAKEHDTLCPDLPAGLADVVRTEGGHHFDGDYRALARLVLSRLQ